MPTLSAARFMRRMIAPALALLLGGGLLILTPSFATTTPAITAPADTLADSALQSLATDLWQLRETQRAQLAAADDPARVDEYDQRLGMLRQRIARHMGYVQACAPQGEPARRLIRLQQSLGRYLALDRDVNRALHAGDPDRAGALALGPAGQAHTSLLTELHGLHQSLALAGSRRQH